MAQAARDITIDDLKRMDLDKLRGEIQELEGRLELQIREAQKEIDGRKAFLKAVEILINGKPPRKARVLKPKAERSTNGAGEGAAGPEKGRRGRLGAADRCAEYLRGREHASVKEIAKGTGLTEATATFALNNDERFDVNAVGLWELL